MDKVIFFNVDGTLTTAIGGVTFKQNPTDIKPIEGVEAGLKYFKEKDYTLIGISNQGGVAAGHKSFEDTIEEMQNTLDLLPQIESIYICLDFHGNQAYKINPDGWKVFYRSQLPHPHVDTMPVFIRMWIQCLLLNYFANPEREYFLRHSLDDSSLFELWMVGDGLEHMEIANQASINYMRADIFHKRFTTGIHEFKDLTSKQIEFLEF